MFFVFICDKGLFVFQRTHARTHARTQARTHIYSVYDRCSWSRFGIGNIELGRFFRLCSINDDWYRELRNVSNNYLLHVLEGSQKIEEVCSYNNNNNNNN